MKNNKKREKNPFEEEIIASEWIKIIETERRDSARSKDIYPRLSQWLGQFKRGIILDIGAGQGKTSTIIKKKGLKYVGVEPSKILVERAKELYSRRGFSFLVGNAYKLPVKSRSITGAFSVAVLFHLKNLGDAAKELARVLKKEGKFYIITANPAAYAMWESWFARLGKYQKRGKKIEGKIGTKDWRISKNIFYLHTLSEIIQSLENYNLKIDEIETFNFKGRNKTRGLWLGIEGHKA